MEGRLWIHAASKVPDESTVKAMENFYREIYALDGVTDLKFPEHYPVSKLIGKNHMLISYCFSKAHEKVQDNFFKHILKCAFGWCCFHLGCIEVVGCLRCDELSSWKAVPEGVRKNHLVCFLNFFFWIFDSLQMA